MEPIVKCTNVNKTYSFYKKQSDKMLDILSIKKKHKNFSALKGITFQVNPGESIGIIGINGSGKSTLSNLLAQVVAPTSGKISIKGESSLIAITAGLNNNLTGLENIQLKCLMLGLKADEIKEITPKIIEFADIGYFIHQPVKNYSSGMKSRLGFAVSIHTNPNVLIIDEALSVGDQTFYEKCIKKMEDFKSQGKTIFFISHSIGQMRTFCDRVIWLHFGKIREFGNSEEVLDQYKEFIDWFNSLDDIEKKTYKDKMLKEQFNDNRKNIRSFSRISNKRNKRRKRKMFIQFMSFTGQLLILFLILSLSMFFMLNTNQSTINTSKVKSAGLNNLNSPKSKNEAVDVKGFITGESVDVFSSKSFSNKISALPFGSPIFIVDREGDAYKIQYNSTDGYIRVNDAEVMAKDLPQSKYKIEDLLVFLPDSFSHSYNFFLAQLGLNYDKIKGSLRGLSNETTDIQGNSVLVYNYDNIMYMFNNDKISSQIKILNINEDNNTFTNLEASASVKDKNNNLFFTIIKDYEVIVNKQEKSITLIPNKQGA